MNTATSSAPGSVLLAEDSPSNQRLTTLFLERAGCRVDIASNGAEAVEAARRRRYDLILMDILMPHMDGLEATFQIRNDSANPDTPIVALTGDTTDEHRRACLAAGMNDLLAKPLRKATLLKALGDWQVQTHPTAAAEDAQPRLLNAATLDALEKDTSADMLPELVFTLLDEADVQVREIRECVGQQDAKCCVFKAHSLKSNASAIGADRLHELAVQLENSAARLSPQELGGLSDELETVLAHTRDAFAKRLQQGSTR